MLDNQQRNQRDIPMLGNLILFIMKIDEDDCLTQQRQLLQPYYSLLTLVQGFKYIIKNLEISVLCIQKRQKLLDTY